MLCKWIQNYFSKNSSKKWQFLRFAGKKIRLCVLSVPKTYFAPGAYLVAKLKNKHLVANCLH